MSFAFVRGLCVSLVLTTAVQAADGDEVDSPRILKDESQTTSGTLTIKGAKLPYQAEAGVEVVYLKDPKDDDPQPKNDKGDPPPIPQHASMSYVAYFKGDHEDAHRPITFLFNGGPNKLAADNLCP